MHVSRLRVDAQSAGLRADAFLSRELPGLSRARVRTKIQMGEALLNGKRFATSTRLREGDEMTVPVRSPLAAVSARDARDARDAHPDQAVPDLPVLYEDEHLLAVDKPAGMATHPMGRMQAGTVIQLIRRRHAVEIHDRLGRGDTDWYPRPINRLDVFTSGVVLVARTRDAQKVMQVMMGEGRVSKEYVALVEGVVRCGRGCILLPLGFDPHSQVRVKMAALPQGKPSVTRFEVMRRMPRHTLLRVLPETGRQHQVRVHLAAIGHPVAGDLLYKDEALFLRYQANGGLLDETLPRRHCLHAARIQLIHPFTGLPVSITSPLPADFAAMVSAAE